MPLKVLKQSLPFIEDSFANKIEQNITEIRAMELSLKEPKLPLIESPALYRIIAHLIGDGSQASSHEPYYSNTCKKLRDQFIDDLKVIGKIDYKVTTPNTTPIVAFPKVVSDILMHLFDVKFTRPDRLPQILFSANEENKIEFLKALFDDEGTISSNLSIGINNLRIITEIKEILKELNIETGKIISKDYKTKTGQRTMYYFQILNKSYKTFNDLISFNHPIKKEKLFKTLEIKTRERRTRPESLFDKGISNLLKVKPCRTIELSLFLQLTISHTLRHLKRLKETGIISNKKIGGYFLWYLIMDESTPRTSN